MGQPPTEIGAAGVAAAIGRALSLTALGRRQMQARFGLQVGALLTP